MTGVWKDRIPLNISTAIQTIVSAEINEKLINFSEV